MRCIAKTASYTIQIKGLPSADGTISVKALTELLQDLQQAARRSVRLLLDGSSLKHGPPPAWLEAATDFLFTGIGQGSTVLAVSTPVLGDAAAEFLQQPDMWRVLPTADDTALSVLVLSMKDAAAGSLNSDRFDRGVLESFVHMDRFFTYAESVEITRRDREEAVTFALSPGRSVSWS